MKRQGVNVWVGVLVCFLFFVATVQAGDPNCQSGYISNPYNNNPAPRRIIVKNQERWNANRIQNLQTKLDEVTFSPESSATPSPSAPSTSSSPIQATQTAFPGDTSSAPSSAPTITPASSAAPTTEPSPTSTPASSPTTAAPAPTTSAPSSPPTTPSPVTPAPSCFVPVYSNDPTPGIKWNGYNTLQINYVCVTSLQSVTATYLDVNGFSRTAGLSRRDSTFFTTLSYSMLAVQNVQITVTTSNNAISVVPIQNKQDDVDFQNVYFNQTIVPVTVPGKVSNVSQLVKSVTNFDLFLGPHNNNALESRCFFPSYINATYSDFAISCQIDCLTKFTWSGNVSDVPVTFNSEPIFTNCTNRYYTYGSHVSQGCISPSMAGTKLSSTALNVCISINKCTLNKVPPSNINDLTQFVLSGVGQNTFNGSKCVNSTIATISPLSGSSRAAAGFVLVALTFVLLLL